MKEVTYMSIITKNIFGKMTLVCFILMYIMAGIISEFPNTEELLTPPMMIVFLIMNICWIIWRTKTKKERTIWKKFKKEEKQKVLQLRQEEKRRQEEIERQKQEVLRIAKERDNNPIAATFMFAKDKYGYNTSDSLALIIGGAIIGGTLGFAYGAHTAQNARTGTTATFSVKYESGRIGTETVDVNSERFQKLATLTMQN